MRHLSDIDAQLGLAPMENFNDADGRGAAKAALGAGIAACGLKHPFSKSKRQACISEKKAIYAAKIAAIDAVKNPVAPVETEKVTEIAEKIPTKSLPTSPRQDSPSVSRAQEQGQADAEAEKSGMPMSTKIAIGVGAAIILIGGFMYMRKK
jgi:hypothetical protein